MTEAHVTVHAVEGSLLGDFDASDIDEEEVVSRMLGEFTTPHFYCSDTGNKNCHNWQGEVCGACSGTGIRIYYTGKGKVWDTCAPCNGHGREPS